MDSPGFERWKAKRAARGATAPKTSDDRDYERFVSAMTGAEAEAMAGVASPQIDGGAVVPPDLTDDQAYAHLLAVVSGEASRLQAQEDVRRDRRERQEEHRRHAREMSYPPRQQYED
ncbi:MAG: hypothetical protein M3Q60_14915 [Actinomycetota bacterium]|nr:hypothetical protein [Actinomycetota bacterium]